jgi:hypothetical protein
VLDYCSVVRLVAASRCSMAWRLPILMSNMLVDDIQIMSGDTQRRGGVRQARFGEGALMILILAPVGRAEGTRGAAGQS